MPASQAGRHGFESRRPLLWSRQKLPPPERWAAAFFLELTCRLWGEVDGVERGCRMGIAPLETVSYNGPTADQETR